MKREEIKIEIFSQEQISKLLNECKIRNNKSYEDEIADKVKKTNYDLEDIETLKQIDKYFIGGISIEDKKYLIELAKDLSITIQEIMRMCESFADEIDYICEFHRIKNEITDSILNKGEFPQEYWDKRKSNSYDWLRCVTPRKNLENEYYLSTVSYYGWDNLKKFEDIEPTSKIDDICKKIALFARDKVSEKYLEGKTILDKIIERIQLTGNYDFEAIALTTVSYHDLRVFDILSDDFVEHLKNIMELEKGVVNE